MSKKQIIDMGNGWGIVLDPTPAPPRPPSGLPRRPDECKGSRVALGGYPMDTPCPHCGRVFEPSELPLLRGDVAFPTHKVKQ